MYAREPEELVLDSSLRIGFVCVSEVVCVCACACQLTPCSGRGEGDLWGKQVPDGLIDLILVGALLHHVEDVADERQKLKVYRLGSGPTEVTKEWSKRSKEWSEEWSGWAGCQTRSRR